MSIAKFFINKSSKNMIIDNYLRNELKRAGYAGVEFQKTPLGNRVVIYAERPGMVIGRQGATIRELAHVIETKYGLENPQIAVVPVQNPELNARIMASRVASALERGIHFRRAAFVALRQIMEAGARGAEIVIRGKLSTERSRYEKFRSGAILKAGEPRKYAVDRAVTSVLLKPGVFGIQVSIYLPVKTVDDISIVEVPQQAAG
ncbi:MAG: 30S ribosomal protein S3 [Candidatus Methanomethylicia archaeon]|jgi:small subunit ribosomal protein S3|nr:30S ribosomal protein S3 [Candidatus Methanomethylicia archaeon]MCQ5374720.1 30S ribosomal protein S3 [Candidatus Methanomethylicia archaeon]NHV60455.1 30S ribosomal protein S3 [Candidatus Verstraetearchaeota archaeon]